MSSAGEEGLLSQGIASLSADGRFVSLTGWSDLHNPSADCTAVTRAPGCFDLSYVYDRSSGALDLISRSWKGEVPGETDASTISRDGRYAVFSSGSDSVSRDDKNNAIDVFWHDRGPAVLGSTIVARANEASGGRSSTMATPSLLQGADLTSASVAYRPGLSDLFVRMQVEESRPALFGTPGRLYGFSFRIGATRYDVRATRGLGPLGLGGPTFELYRCALPTDPCTKIGDLRGGFGTTGYEVVFSLPLEAIGLRSGDSLQGAEAFTAYGPVGKPVLELDTLSVGQVRLLDGCGRRC